jgi:hypothetical protein
MAGTHRLENRLQFVSCSFESLCNGSKIALPVGGQCLLRGEDIPRLNVQ